MVWLKIYFVKNDVAGRSDSEVQDYHGTEVLLLDRLKISYLSVSCDSLILT